MWIREKGIRYAWCLARNAAFWRHLSRANDPLLIFEIERIPQSAIQRLRPIAIVISKSQRQHQIWPEPPFILHVCRPRSIFELDRASTRFRQLCVGAIWKTQKSR